MHAFVRWIQSWRTNKSCEWWMALIRHRQYSKPPSGERCVAHEKTVTNNNSIPAFALMMLRLKWNPCTHDWFQFLKYCLQLTGRKPCCSTHHQNKRNTRMSTEIKCPETCLRSICFYFIRDPLKRSSAPWTTGTRGLEVKLSYSY